MTNKRTETHSCDCGKEGTHGDVIYRAEAISALKGLPTWWADAGGCYGDAQPPMTALLDSEDAISAIENLPSAEPKALDETDLIELRDRFGDFVEYVVRDMISGKGERWKRKV